MNDVFPRLSAFVLFVGLSLSVGCQNASQLRGPVRPGEVQVADYRARTTDGWELELKRFRLKDAPGLTSPDRFPVVLCHGRTSNGRYWDLTARLSFARYLAERGYDVWVPSLRGCGSSTKPGFVVLREMMRLRLDNTDQLLSFPKIADSFKFNWTFDDYAFDDIPAIIDAVKEHTGAFKVVWIGHSMGGMIMFPYLEHSGRDDVAAFIALASPVYMPQPPNDLYKLLVDNPRLFQLSTAIVNNQLPAAWGALTGKEIQAAFFYSPPNMEPGATRQYLREVTEDTTTGVTAQMLGLLGTGHLRSADGKIDYTADLNRVKVPMLFVSGKADNMCEPACVRYSYERVGSPDKTYRELGLANNYSADYGHLDIILGKRSPEEVFPFLLDWLGKHRSP